PALRSPEVLTTQYRSGGVAVADFDEDGRNDLASVLITGSTLSIFYRQHDLGFEEVRYSTTRSSRDITIRDVNGDGRVDIVVLGMHGVTVHVQVPAKDRGERFPASTTFDLDRSTEPRIAVHDVNGDGAVDLIIAQIDRSSISVATGRKNGAFAPPLSSATPGISSLARWDSPDLNADAPVLTMADGELYRVQLGAGNFPVLRAFRPAGTPDAERVSMRDVNNDGLRDILCFSRRSMAVHLARAPGEYLEPEEYALDSSGSLGTRPDALFDYDGDGDRDLVFAPESSSFLFFFENSGAGRFVSRRFVLVPYEVKDLWSGDLNGDGKLDLIDTDELSTAIRAYPADDFSPYFGGNLVAEDRTAFAVGDFDGDRRNDILVSGDNQRQLLRNTGPAGFVPDDPIPVSRNALSYRTHDVDRDGDLDCFVLPAGFGVLGSLLINDGRGRFLAQDFVSAPFLADAEFADVNSDGLSDLVSVAPLTIQRGLRDGSFSVPETISTDNNQSNVSCGDFDGDGWDDIVTSSRS
ncbi:MAG: VCBS repeat-containing protein, partial [Planctomycetota bacterium]